MIGDDLRGRNESFKTHEKDILTKVIFFMMEGDDFDRKGRFEWIKGCKFVVKSN